VTVHGARVEDGRLVGQGAASRRWLNRTAAIALATVALVVLYLLVVRPLLPESSSAQPTPIERPATVPERVPAWAWQLHGWHLTDLAERGPRPAAAPASVPRWYWDFRRWRLSLAPAK
jgi:hypothetical protein